MSIDWRGAVNGVATTDVERTEMFLKIFNRVFAAFEAKSDTLDFFTVKSVGTGRKEEQFILMDSVQLGDINYKTDPNDGQDYATSETKQATKDIKLDANETVYSKQTKITDQSLSHYDVQALIQASASNAFALAKDLKNYVSLAKGSEATHPTDNQPGGVKITAANFGTDITATMAVFDDIVSTYEERSIPIEDCQAWVSPRLFNWLKTAGKDFFINSDYSRTGEGFEKNTKKLDYSGLTIIKSASFNNFAGNNLTNVSGNDRYAYDATHTKMLVGHPVSIGTLVALDVRLAYDDTIARNGKERMTILKQDGVDWLNPQTCVQVATQ